jgi:tripartite-type tricarboxylate transporter receptor subunit TctC
LKKPFTVECAVTACGDLDTTALIGGHVQLMFDFASVIGPHVKSGRLKALAVASDKRLTVLPEVPTFDEQGHAGMRITGWQGILAPVGTPPEVIGKLNRSLVRALNLPDIRERPSSAPAAKSAATRPSSSRRSFVPSMRGGGKIIAEARVRLE